MSLIDSNNRSIEYLRLSLLDACNFRCKYCLPNNNIFLLQQKEWLKIEEINFLVRVLADLGINKIRLTGGEPTLRKDFIEIAKNIKSIESLSLHLTTNASWKDKKVTKEISEIFEGVNISLDSLHASSFNKITQSTQFNRVWQNIIDLHSSGMPIKLNMVVMKGVNEEEIINFIELTKEFEFEVRFLESMPFDGRNNLKSEYFVPYTEIFNLASNQYKNSIVTVQSNKSSTSKVYKIDNYKGKWAIIPSFSRTFCADCNRIRITSKGEMINCLYQNEGINIKNLIRSGISEDELKMELNKWVKFKPKDGFEAQKTNKQLSSNSMSIIGG